MPLSTGTELGCYKILSALGAGGMGEVYRARDTRLDRDVAIKVLPAGMADDRERLARFEREAKVLASLNHPNIAQVHGFEPIGESRALVMELVGGSILTVPQPLETALEYAAQIAAALEAAHERGITHRDLKPANIMVTADGVVKVLDFGLATVPPQDPTGNPSESPTMTLQASQAGMIMGTAAYMSPEQAAGKPVDKRSDIWSFGLVVCEMLNGRKVFEAESVAHTLADVLRAPLNYDELTASAPEPIAALLKRCLDRDPKTRLRDIGEARIAIRQYLAAPNSAKPSASPRPQPRLGWIVAAGMAVAAAGLGYLLYRHSEVPPPKTVRAFLLPPEKSNFVATSPPALSPDGRRLAFTAAGSEIPLLWIRELDSVSARSISGTEGARDPFWSPDGQSVGFFTDGQLKRVDLAGGSVRTLCYVQGGLHGASWSTRDIILFPNNQASGLYAVSGSGGTPAPVTTLDAAAGEISHRLPWFLPDGHHFIYTVRNQDQSAKSALSVGDLDSKNSTILVRGEAHGVFVSAGGYLVFAQGSPGNISRPILAQRMDPSTFRLSGEPIPIAESVEHSPGIWAQHQFSASQDGTLIYSSGGTQARHLTWMSRSGEVLGTIPNPGGDTRVVSISPDGKTVALSSAQGGSVDIWLYGMDRGSLSRFTFNPPGTVSLSPAWSPDSTALMYPYSSSSKPLSIMKQSVGGQAAPEPVGTGWGDPPRRVIALGWSRDGRFAVGRLLAGGVTGVDLWLMPLSPTVEKPRPLLQGPGNEISFSLSPGSDWIAYASDESRRFEIYVQSFPLPGRKYQVSMNGGGNPVWSRDGKELFFIAPDRQMMAVTVRKIGGGLEIGRPKALFDSRMQLDTNAAFDVADDGRFLIPVAPDAGPAAWTLVTNWQAGLKK